MEDYLDFNDVILLIVTVVLFLGFFIFILNLMLRRFNSELEEISSPNIREQIKKRMLDDIYESICIKCNSECVKEDFFCANCGNKIYNVS